MIPVFGLNVVENLLVIRPVNLLILLLSPDGDVSKVLEAMSS